MKTMEANKMEPFEPTHPGEVKEGIHNHFEWNLKSSAGILDLDSFKCSAEGDDRCLLNEVLNGKRTLNTEMALLISAALDIDAEPLLAMQTRYDVINARRNQSFVSKLRSVRKIAAAF